MHPCHYLLNGTCSAHRVLTFYVNFIRFSRVENIFKKYSILDLNVKYKLGRLFKRTMREIYL